MSDDFCRRCGFHRDLHDGDGSEPESCEGARVKYVATMEMLDFWISVTRERR